MGAGCEARGTGWPRYDSIAVIMEGLPEPPYQPLYLMPFHCAGLCDEVINDAAGGAAFAHAETQRRCGRDGGWRAGRECRWPRRLQRRHVANAFDSETRVIGNAETLFRIFLGVNVGGDGLAAVRTLAKVKSSAIMPRQPSVPNLICG